jgi:hypothetical protein
VQHNESIPTDCCKKLKHLFVFYWQIISIKIAYDLQVDEIQRENEDLIRENIDGIL